MDIPSAGSGDWYSNSLSLQTEEMNTPGSPAVGGSPAPPNPGGAASPTCKTISWGLERSAAQARVRKQAPIYRCGRVKLAMEDPSRGRLAGWRPLTSYRRVEPFIQTGRWARCEFKNFVSPPFAWPA
jgi:hypothetical protein